MQLKASRVAAGEGPPFLRTAAEEGLEQSMLEALPLGWQAVAAPARAQREGNWSPITRSS